MFAKLVLYFGVYTEIKPFVKPGLRKQKIKRLKNNEIKGSFSVTGYRCRYRCQVRDRGSILSVCQITLGKLANLNHTLNGGLLLD